MFVLFWHLVGRECILILRAGLGGGTPLAVVFLLSATVLFSLGVGLDPELLTRSAPGIIWALAVLASLLSLERIFQPDDDNGTLELLALSYLPLMLVALAKATAHWLTSGLPVAIIAACILPLMLYLPVSGLPTLMAALLLGTPILSLLGVTGAALALGARGQGVLIAVLMLPFHLPVLIFGAGAVEAAINGLPVSSHLMLLAALLIGSLPLTCWAAGTALEQSLE